MEHDDRHTAARRRLDAFVGEWRMEASFPDTAPAEIAGRTLVGRVVFEWILDGQFLAERAGSPEGGAPESWAVIGVAADGEAYTQHYFDSRAVTRVYAMTFDDSVWTLLRETPDFTPLDFAQRFTGRLSADGRTISGRWELRSHGADWQHDFDLTYTRLG